MDAGAKTTNAKRKKKRGEVETDGERSVAYERRVRQASRVLRSPRPSGGFTVVLGGCVIGRAAAGPPSQGTPNKGNHPERKRRRGGATSQSNRARRTKW
ncbi:hypothetical protein MTO96_027257 [Rhipicephalus appendiculatus]